MTRVAAALAAVLLLVPNAGRSASLPAATIAAYAHEAYVYGYPLVLTATTEEQQLAEFHRFGLSGLGVLVKVRDFPPPGPSSVVAPNTDTLYSFAWLDVSAEPVVVHLPDTRGRYVMMPMLDGWTDVIASPGSRTTGTAPRDVAVVGPGWHGTLPRGPLVVRSPTALVWVIGRTAASPSARDLAAARDVQDGYHVAPLSAFGSGRWNRTVSISATRYRPALTPPQQVAALDAPAFFTRLAQLLAADPPTPADAPVVAHLTALGIVAGRPFDAHALAPEARAALDTGIAAARAQLAATDLATLGRHQSGWRWSDRLGAYGKDYLLRAVAAQRLLGANLAADALYPTTSVDVDGAPLDGARSYVLHFPPGQLPPVHGFWSLTTYDANGYLVANTIDRYSVGSQTGLVPHHDGSLDVIVAHDPPAGNAHNWLPAPSGRFTLVLRTYWPRPAMLRGVYSLPLVAKGTRA